MIKPMMFHFNADVSVMSQYISFGFLEAQTGHRYSQGTNKITGTDTDVSGKKEEDLSYL